MCVCVCVCVLYAHVLLTFIVNMNFVLSDFFIIRWYNRAYYILYTRVYVYITSIYLAGYCIHGPAIQHVLSMTGY